MKKKLLFLALACGLSLASSSAQAVYHPCDTYCPTHTLGTQCQCPPTTDRPYATVFCGGWNRVGGCWYE
jgi:hypothetical protein